MSNPADAVNARTKALLEERLFARQARHGGYFATAADLKVGDRFLTGAGGPGGETVVEITELKIAPGEHGAVWYKGEWFDRFVWLPAASMVLILGPMPGEEI